MAKDYYQQLGVPRDASLSQIKSAYRRLSLRHHPDRTGREECQPFLAIKEAYETLSDPARRDEYDRQLRARDRRSRHASRSDPFGAAPVHVAPAPDPFPDLELTLTAEDAAAGGCLSLEVPLGQTCRRCGGSGRSGPWLCQVCGGQGQVETYQQVDVLIPRNVRSGAVILVHLPWLPRRGLRISIHVYASAWL